MPEPEPGTAALHPEPTSPAAAAPSELAVFRDEVALASEALRGLIDGYRSQLADLSADVSDLRDTVAAMRTEIALPSAQLLGQAPPATPANPALQPVITDVASLDPLPTSVVEPPQESSDSEPPNLTGPVQADLPAEPTAPVQADLPAEPTEPTEPHTAEIAATQADDAARRPSKLEAQAAAAVTSAAARIGLPPAHVDVLKQWVAHGGRGVIEVAHAGGRHRVGLAAIVYAVSTGRQVLVVVPNRESADSWRASLARHAPEVVVLIDEGRRRDVDGATPNVVLSTASTTARRITAGFEPAALLVAIDADRFGTALLAKALDERCEWRLGLSESFRSGSRRLARYADAYFGGTVLTIS